MKKTFALMLALVVALCAMSISAFAVSFDFEDGSLGDWYTHGGQGNLSVVDGALLTTGRWNGAFKTAYALGTLTAGTTYDICLDIYAPVSDFDIDGAITYTIHIVNAGEENNLDGNDYASEKFVITSGEWTTVSFTYTPDADATYAVLAVNTIEHDPWARSPEFSIDNVSVTEGVAETPAVEEPPAEETPVVEDTPVEETPVEETPVESEPAETGLALAVVPMIVAAAVVALSKKR